MTRDTLRVDLGGMRILLALMMVIGMALPALAAEVCPEVGKVEANDLNQDEINNLVLPAGTLVCIKGSTKMVNVVADGESTLMELLDSRNQNDQLQDVSHYTVTTTTTTTTPEETTTSALETTTSSEATTTTGAPTTTTLPTTQPTLPFTGLREVLTPLAVTLLVVGILLLVASRGPKAD